MRRKKLKKLFGRISGRKVSRRSELNFLRTLKFWIPNSDGWEAVSSKISEELAGFHELLQPFLDLPDVDSPAPSLTLEDRKEKAILDQLFSESGSDKAENGYSATYADLLHRIKTSRHLPDEGVINVAEIGIGTVNPKVPSYMNPGRFVPGGSLRAFSKFSPNISVLGGDIDPTTLINDGQIKSKLVDSFNESSVREFFGHNRYNLIIDDGLHFIGTQLRTLTVGLDRLVDGGFIVIEDIPERSINVFRVLSFVLSAKGFSSAFVKSTKPKYLFVVENTSTCAGAKTEKSN